MHTDTEYDENYIWGGVEVCSVVDRTYFDGTQESFERTCMGMRVVNYDGMTWELRTPEGDTQFIEEVYGMTQYDSYKVITDRYDSWCAASDDPNCVPDEYTYT
jgi:hypothetical protein